MTLRHVVWRTIRHYRGSSLAVMAGLAVATAVITGSLIIGSSLRGSLFDLSLSRLGAVNHAAVLPRAVSDGIVAGTSFSALLQTTGTASPAEGEPTPVTVTVWGMDQGFCALQHLPSLPSDGLFINAALARDLQVKAGDEIALSVNRPRAIGMDSLFARRKLADVMATLQLPVTSVLPDNGPGDFRLDGQSARPRNAFISREALAQVLDLPGKANVLAAPVQQGGSSDLTAILTPRLSLADHGLHLRVKPSAVSLTSDGFTLTEALSSTVAQVARELGGHADAVSVYLATTIRAANGREIAYAIISGNEDARRLGLPRSWPDKGDAIVLNTWAAQDLQAKPGDTLTLEYLVPSPDGSFPRRKQTARLLGLVPIQGPTADAHLMPEYEGLTDAVTLGDWKPPFPIDISRVTPRDEQYWEKYKTVPKAFLPLAAVEEMWGGSPNTVTSIEITPPPGQSPTTFAPAFEAKLLASLQTSQPVIVFRDMAEQARQAATGSTDFGQLFLALSMFIIAAGAGLATMLVRLGVERRTGQIGLLLAIGVTPQRVRALLLTEGMVLNLGGVLLGLPLGVLYAVGLLRAMGVFWRAAIGDAPALWLHAGPMDLPYAALGGSLTGLLTIVLTLRGLGRLEPMRLWQSGLTSEAICGRRPAGLLATLAVTMAATVGLLVWTQVDAAAPRAVVFFGAGFLLLAGGLMALKLGLTWPRRRSVLQSRSRLAWRNAAQNPRRSVLVCGLIAAATFVIIATAASTRDLGRTDTFDRAGPSGGFNLMATSQVPLPYDPATPEGRRHLGFAAQDEELLSRCTIASMLASPGDDLSCANSARPNTPRLLGGTDNRNLFGGGRFQAVSLGICSSVLRGDRDIIALTDRDTLEWRLHKKSAERWATRDTYGRPLTIVLFAGFSRSIFAGQLLTSERELRLIYPEVTSPSFFLIDTPRQDEQAAVASLRRTLGDLGLQVRPTREVLAEYAGAENVYISMFLALGALGLLLGTVGLSVVTVRNVVERRAELALLAAIGFSERSLVLLLLLEHGGLVALGLLVGAVAALVAMVPQLAAAESSVNWPGLGAALAAVLIVGLGANVVAIRTSLRQDLIGGLRHE